MRLWTKYEHMLSPSGFARANLHYALIGGIDPVSPDFHLLREHYPAYELLYILQGRGWFVADNRELELTAGDGLLYDMRRPHVYRSDAADPFVMMFLVFNGHELDRLWASWIGVPALHLPARAGRDEPYAASLRSILDWMADPGYAHEANISSLLYQMLLEIMLRCRTEGPDRGGVKPESLERGRLYLEENYVRPIDLRQAAAAAGLSYYHFIRQFNRYFACSPKEYLTRTRIGHAKQLLLYSDMPVARIAEASGFGSYNAFLNTFLRLESCSPTLYRKTWGRYRDPGSG